MFVVILLIVGFVFVCALYFLFKDHKKQPTQSEQPQSDAQQQEWAEEQAREWQEEQERAYTNAQSYQEETELIGCFEILEVHTTASEEEVKDAWRKLSKRCHPDTYQTDDPRVIEMAAEKFNKIQKAYERIKQYKGWK